MHAKIETQTFLSRLPLFSHIEPAALERIAAGTTELRIPRGEIIVNRDDPCVGFHLVVYGQVKLALVTPNGDEKILEIIGAGHSFGESVMFLERPYLLMAQALADSLLLHVSREAVFEGIERDAGFAKMLLAGLSVRLQTIITDIESYSLQSATERVISYLLQRHEQHEPSDTSHVVTLSTSKTLVASRLNLTPEHFSRVLHELSEANLISVTGRDVRIHDVARLRAHHPVVRHPPAR
jgi:CRP/FNR family transcriptional regulator, dissimilatory nitrate respiration regulator